MSWDDEYHFHSPRYRTFDKALIEEKLRSFPYTAQCKDRYGSPFYLIVGDEEAKRFIHDQRSENLSASQLEARGSFVWVEDDQVVVSGCPFDGGSVDEVVRSFCAWLLDEFGCSIKDEFGSPTSVEEMFR